MWRLKTCFSLILSFSLLSDAGPQAGQQGPEAKPTRLATAKLIFVEHMPQSLDRWLIEDLRVWGKYKRESNPEGVDLVFHADFPEHPVEILLRGGIPQPRQKKKGGDSSSEQCPYLKPGEAVPTISVIDWVTGERLWYAHLIDKKPKKEAAEAPPGPHTDVFTRGLTPDQVAMKVVSRLREYEGELEKEVNKR